MSIRRSSMVLLGARFLNALSLFCLVVLISRTLGPEDFGSYAFLNAVILTGNVIAAFGLDTFMVRELSRDRAEGPMLLSSVLLCKVLTSLLVIITIWVIFGIQLRDRPLFQLLWIFSVVVLLNSASQSLWHYGDAFQRFGVHSALWAFSNLIKLPLVWVLLHLSTDLRMVILGLVGAEGAAALVSIIVVRRRFRLHFEVASPRSVISLLKRTWVLSVVYAVSALYLRIDLVMLEFMKGSEAVGIYAAACKVIEFLIVIPGTVAMASLPALARSHKEDATAFRRQAVSILLILSAVGAFLGAILFLASRKVIGVIYGASYTESVWSLRILSLAVLFLFMNSHLSQMAIATHRERSLALIVLSATIANILMNLWMIPLYSHIGAALATLVSEVFMILLFGTVFPGRVNQRPRVYAVSSKRI